MKKYFLSFDLHGRRPEDYPELERILNDGYDRAERGQEASTYWLYSEIEEIKKIERILNKILPKSWPMSYTILNPETGERVTGNTTCGRQHEINEYLEKMDRKK